MWFVPSRSIFGCIQLHPRKHSHLIGGGGIPHPLHPQFPNRRFPSPINPWLSIVLAHIWFSNPYANFSLYAIFSENWLSRIEGRVTQWSEKLLTISTEHTIWVPILVKGAEGEHLFWQLYLNDNGLPVSTFMLKWLRPCQCLLLPWPSIKGGLVRAPHIRAQSIAASLFTQSINAFHSPLSLPSMPYQRHATDRFAQ